MVCGGVKTPLQADADAIFLQVYRCRQEKTSKMGAHGRGLRSLLVSNKDFLELLGKHVGYFCSLLPAR